MFSLNFRAGEVAPEDDSNLKVLLFTVFLTWVIPLVILFNLIAVVLGSNLPEHTKLMLQLKFNLNIRGRNKALICSFS
jgi:hypothetical protein